MVGKNPYNKQMVGRRKQFEMKRTAGEIKNGFFLNKNNLFVQMFGCARCQWIDTKMCPHLGDVTKLATETKPVRLHANGICSQRAKWFAELIKMTGGQTKAIQVDHIVKLQFLTDDMLARYLKSGELPKTFDKLSKNLIGALDKLRRQDEGIKINREDIPAADKLRDVVDAQFEVIKENEGKEDGSDKKQDRSRGLETDKGKA